MGKSDPTGQAMTWAWGTTVDGSGNVYTTGCFEDTVDFDPGSGTANRTSNGNSDIFVHKMDGDGNFMWARRMGEDDDNQGFDYGLGVAVDASGDVYTTGKYSGSIDIDPGAGTSTLPYGGGIFVQKLDSDGIFVWGKGILGGFIDAGVEVFVDASGNVLVTGYFSRTVDFDSGPDTANLTAATSGSTSGVESDIFVLKIGFSKLPDVYVDFFGGCPTCSVWSSILWTVLAGIGSC